MKSEFVLLGKFNFCEENGYFCRYMDRYGHCIATSCKQMTQIEERLEEEARAQFEKEIIDGRIDLYDAASDDFVELDPNIIFEED